MKRRAHVFWRVGILFLLVGGGVSVAQPALAGTATIVNGTRKVMVSLQTKSANSRWQGNALSDGPLGVKKQTTIYLSSGSCMYDIMATFEDGHRVTRQNVNLCSPSAFVLRDF